MNQELEDALTIENIKDSMEQELEQVIKSARKKQKFSADYIAEEIKRIEEYQKGLKYKLMMIGKAVVEKNIKIPSKFKKVEEIIKDEENLKKFYYNLFFYGFVEYDVFGGYLLKDKKNFHLKITIFKDGSPSGIDYKEELYITEEKAEEILRYDVTVDEEIEKSEEETENAREKYLAQFKEYSE